MFEEYSKQATMVLAAGVELVAALLIGLAVVRAAVHALAVFVQGPTPTRSANTVRLELGRWLALALEFALAADILRTAVAPSWNDIGQLAAIIVLRTVLNFFLQREIDRAASRGEAPS